MHAPTGTAPQKPYRGWVCMACGPGAPWHVAPVHSPPQCNAANMARLATLSAAPSRRAEPVTAPMPPRHTAKRVTSLPLSARDAPSATPVVEPARLVSALDKLARAGHSPEPTWIDMYLAVSEPVLSTLSVQQLATVARALSRLGVEVPERWARALLEASEVALPSADSASDVAELLIWASVDGRLMPEAAWVGTALQQIQRLSADRPGVLSPSQAADVAWAVARMGYRPADPLLDCLAAATLGMPYREAVPGWESAAPDGGGDGGDADAPERRTAPEAAPAGRASRPSASGLDAVPLPGTQLVGGGGLSELPAEQLARLAWAFASYNYFPPDPWVQAYWLRGIWTRGLSPEGATAVLWSLGCLQLPLEGLWLRNYCLTTTGRLHEIPPEGLINALWAIAACREVARAADVASPAPPAAAGPLAPTGAPAESARDTVATGAAGTGPQVGQGEGGTAVAAAAGRAADAAAGAEEDPVETLRRLQGPLEYIAGQELLERQLEALLRLRDGGGGGASSPEQREALTRLQEAIDRRLSGGGAAAEAASDDDDGAADGSLPAAWTTEWYDATLPYLEQLDKTLVVKALWATASLELRPPASWLLRVTTAAASLVAAGAMEPLEVLYGSRSADALLSRRDRGTALPPPRAGAGGRLVFEAEDGDESEEEAAEAEAREALGRFAAESFAALSRQKQMPAAWRRLNVRFPPYAQPKRGVGPQAPPEASTGTAAVVGSAGPSARGIPGPVVPGAGLLRPFQ